MGVGVGEITDRSVAVGGTVCVAARGVGVALEATGEGDDAEEDDEGDGEEDEEAEVDDGEDDEEVAEGVAGATLGVRVVAEDVAGAVAVHVAVDSLPGVSVAVGVEIEVPTGSHVNVMRPRGNCFSVHKNWSLTCCASALFISRPNSSLDRKPMSTTTAVVATSRQRRREAGDRRSGEMGYS